MEQNNKVGLEMDCGHRLFTDRENGSCTMKLDSVIGDGVLTEAPGEEKRDALCVLTRRYAIEAGFWFNEPSRPKYAYLNRRCGG